MGMGRYFLSQGIRKYVDSNETMAAILQTSAALEQLFFYQLYFERNISLKLMERENWTLGRYIRWVLELNLIDKKWENDLKRFNRLRNEVVHVASFIDGINSNPEKLKRTKKLILSLCDLMDQTRITTNMEKEAGLSEFYRTQKEFEI